MSRRRQARPYGQAGTTTITFTSRVLGLKFIETLKGKGVSHTPFTQMPSNQLGVEVHIQTGKDHQAYEAAFRAMWTYKEDISHDEEYARYPHPRRHRRCAICNRRRKIA